jgi:hypothetical protein
MFFLQIIGKNQLLSTILSAGHPMIQILTAIKLGFTKHLFTIPIILLNWTFLFSNGWLGEETSYEYELPNLYNLAGWSYLWYTQESIDSYQFFDAVAGNNNNLIRYITEPVVGLEKSIFSYGKNVSL